MIDDDENYRMIKFYSESTIKIEKKKKKERLQIRSIVDIYVHTRCASKKMTACQSAYQD